jgi:two-component system, NarL family, response regulator NreC
MTGSLAAAVMPVSAVDGCRTCNRSNDCIGSFAADRKAVLERAMTAARGAQDTSPTSVILCSDQLIVRGALRMLIETRGNYRVAIETAICPRALELLAGSGVDVVLLDYDLNDGSEQGLTRLRSLLSAAPDLPVLILSATPQPEACHHAFQFGARGLLLKSKPLEELFGAIDRIRRGERWLEGPALESLLRQNTRARRVSAEDARIAQVTKREREIIAVVASGRTNRQVAQQLFISGATVRHHLSAIFEKLGLSTRGELIVYAYRHRLVDRSTLEHS